MDRRTFLTDLSRYAFFCAGVPNAWRVTARPRFTDDPFALGVASGDPTSDSCVIWTRLATDPLAPLGGLNGLRTVIGWEVAHDEAFSRIVRQGRYTCAPELSFSAHVDVEGLEPNRWYFYRFTTNEGSSPVGRLRTTPPPGAVQPLDLAFVSCNHWEQGLFTAYRHLADEELDLVAHLGDYIYEYAGNTARVRTHASREVVTLDDYRGRYAQYKSDPQLQAAHAGRPWLVTWDDHEVDNNYAGLVGENRFESREQMQQRRAAGYQAWWEHQPVRVPRPDSWADLTIQRSATWGSLRRRGKARALWRLGRSGSHDAGTCSGAMAPRRIGRLLGALAGAGPAGHDGTVRPRARRQRPHVHGPMERLPRRSRPAAPCGRRASAGPNGGAHR